MGSVAGFAEQHLAAVVIDEQGVVGVGQDLRLRSAARNKSHAGEKTENQRTGKTREKHR